MKDFQVPTRPVWVEVYLVDGRHFSGRMFLAENAHMNGSTDLLISALNDERNFLPFEICDDRSARSLVLNKEHIVRVRIVTRGEDDLGTAEESAAAASDTGDTPAAADVAILHLSDGSRISGRVAVQTPASLSRAVDKLNHALRFLPVVSDEGIDVVQRCHVTALD